MKTTFVRRPQFEDALQESFKTWGVKLPSRGGAAMWDGWQPIGFNGPIPLFTDPAQRSRELSEAARDVTIQQRAQETGTSTTQVRMEQDAADGRPPPGAPAAGQGGFQHPPVGGSASKPPTSDVATDPLFNWYADAQPEAVPISTPRDEGQAEQEAVAAAEATQQTVQQVSQNFLNQFNANLFYAQLGGQQGQPASSSTAAPRRERRRRDSR